MSLFITIQRRFLRLFNSRSTSNVSKSFKMVYFKNKHNQSIPIRSLFISMFFFYKDLEFKIIYVGSAETVEFDQTLDQIVVDAVPKGQFKFMFQVNLTCVNSLLGYYDNSQSKSQFYEKLLKSILFCLLSFSLEKFHIEMKLKIIKKNKNYGLLFVQ